jgi:hypothetical protein
MRGVFSVLLLLAPVCEAFTVPRAPHGLMKLARPCRRSVAPSASLDVVDPSYNLALGSLALGAVFGLPPRSVDTLFETIVSRAAYLVGTLCATFGLFIAFQTTTLRFTFDETSFALVKADLSSTGENVVVGGENVWKYSEFVNYVSMRHSPPTHPNPHHLSAHPRLLPLSTRSIHLTHACHTASAGFLPVRELSNPRVLQGGMGPPPVAELSAWARHAQPPCPHHVPAAVGCVAPVPCICRLFAYTIASLPIAILGGPTSRKVGRVTAHHSLTTPRAGRLRPQRRIGTLDRGSRPTARRLWQKAPSRGRCGTGAAVPQDQHACRQWA